MKFVSHHDIEATSNEVIDRYSDPETKLTVQILDDSAVLIEGNANSLEFLANYILAYINDGWHSLNINPNGAGGDFFTSKSTHGIYIHILPCRHGHPED